MRDLWTIDGWAIDLNKSLTETDMNNWESLMLDLQLVDTGEVVEGVEVTWSLENPPIHYQIPL